MVSLINRMDNVEGRISRHGDKIEELNNTPKENEKEHMNGTFRVLEVP